MKRVPSFDVKTILPGLLVAVAIFLCCAAGAQSGQDNTLTKNESVQGFRLLFDGKSTQGWKGYKNQPTASWSVKDGTLHCRSGENNYGAITADLSTVDQYENFELIVDWKISPKGNSGILYLVTEDKPYSYETGPEYQIIDDKNFPEKLEDWQLTAANYAMNPAPEARPNPAGQWNHTRILKRGNHVEHWLNGKRVVSYELHSRAWVTDKEKGKWRDYPSYGMAEKGYITFQNHGSEAWFKNIKIRKL